MNPTAQRYLSRIREAQTKVYSAVDRKLAAIHAHTRGHLPAGPPPVGSSPLQHIEAANYIISAASVVITDLSAHAQAAGILTREDHETIRRLMSQQRTYADRVSTWARDPRYKEESTEAIRTTVAAEVAAIMDLDDLLRPRSGERAVSRAAVSGDAADR